MEDRDDAELNVLVIEDDEALRALLVEIVTARGHHAVQAASAEEGLAQLPLTTFQVALLDHELPGMHGLVLGEYLRRNNPDIAVALVTGSDEPRLDKRSRALGITHIRKPFQPKDIWRVLDDYAEAARERDERRRRREDEDWGPPIARFADDLTGVFEVPGLSTRVGDTLVAAIKRSLNDLRSASRYTERGRVVALSGLLAARVLGLELPRTPQGRTLYDEYDDVMRARGRRTEFGSEPTRSLDR